MNEGYWAAIAILISLGIYIRWQLYAPESDESIRPKSRVTRAVPLTLFMLTGMWFGISILVPDEYFQFVFALAVVFLILTVVFGVILHRRY